MQESLNLKELLTEVIRQTEPVAADQSVIEIAGFRNPTRSPAELIKPKRDFTTNTQDNVRLVQNHGADAHALGPVSIVLLQDGANELERFALTDTAHRQIGAKLGIPWKFYQRTLADHPDLVCTNVNALFEREPENRLFRVLDGKVRAFLSDRYLRLDNKEILEDILPTITQGQRDGKLRVMSNNIGDDKMHMKVIFTGDELAHEVARVRGEPRIIRPGFRLSNSETGQGSLRMDAFFYDSYCTNGCVFGQQDAFNFSRRHVGGRLIEGVDFEVLSEATRALEDKAVISAVNDGLRAISNPETVAKMAEGLRAAHNSESVKQPVAAVELAVKELDLRETERAGILETFLRDMDHSKFGLSSAVTELANNPETTYERACELEDIGGQILTLSQARWNQFVNAEPVAVAA